MSLTVISTIVGQLPDPVQKEKQEESLSAPVLTVQWIINAPHGQGALMFGLVSMSGTDTYKYTLTYLHLPPWAACVLGCHLIASAVCSPSFSPSLYLLHCVYLTHSSQRGNKLALNNNLTDNYSQPTTQKKEWDKWATGPSPPPLFHL